MGSGQWAVGSGQWAVGSATSTNLATASGLKVTVVPFYLDQFSYAGGELALVPNGTWFVGIDLFRNTLIALPRLGHRGWIPVARCVLDAVGITTIEQIAPALPATRIPLTLQKIRAGQPLNVLVLGSSLAEGSSATLWSGMLFNSAANFAAYKLPNISTFRNFGLGGSPNQYMLSQLGYSAPLGRSSLLDNVDLVVLTCLANDGSYRLSIIEPIIRELRKQGKEVILLTDNPQNPTSSFSTMLTSLLYRDGPEVIRIANLYGVELADTAAYVFEQHLRYGTGIYSDAIHMKSSEPSGTMVAMPSGGHEVYARAVRSVMPLSVQLVGTVLNSYNFDDGVQSFTPYGVASIASISGKLKVVKNTAIANQWGTWVDMPALKNGDTLRIQGTLTFEDGYTGPNIQIGMQGGGSAWGSTVRSTAPRRFEEIITVNRDILSGGRLLIFANNNSANMNSAFAVDDVIITLNPVITAVDNIPNRVEVHLAVPPPRQLTDLKTPNDALVILPKNEVIFSSNNPSRGTLGAHPRGTHSFARRFLETTNANEDLLTLTSGQKALIHGSNAVGFAMVHYALSSDSPSTVEVRRNEVLIKTLSLAAGHNREHYIEILTPTEYGNISPSADATIDLTVTSGTLRIGALIVLTSKLDPLNDYLIAHRVPANKRGANEDPDFDGFNNQLEYALGLSPLDSGLSGAPSVQRNQEFLSFTYRRAQGDGVTYRVETTTDLANPSSWTTVGVNQGFPSPDGTTTASIPILEAMPKCFMRLNVNYHLER